MISSSDGNYHYWLTWQSINTIGSRGYTPSIPVFAEHHDELLRYVSQNLGMRVAITSISVLATPEQGMVESHDGMYHYWVAWSSGGSIGSRGYVRPAPLLAIHHDDVVDEIYQHLGMRVAITSLSLLASPRRARMAA